MKPKGPKAPNQTQNLKVLKTPKPKPSKPRKYNARRIELNRLQDLEHGLEAAQISGLGFSAYDFGFRNEG